MAALTRLRVDLGSGKVESSSFAAGSANEFPTINPSYVGKRHRYAYIACIPSTGHKACSSRSLAVDVESGAVTTHDFDPTAMLASRCFVPTGARRRRHSSFTLLFDAADKRVPSSARGARLAAKPLVHAHLKHHVPYPLHGCFAPA